MDRNYGCAGNSGAAFDAGVDAIGGIFMELLAMVILISLLKSVDLVKRVIRIIW